jgi:hypothetical protein
MAQLERNVFSTYQLDEKELEAGQLLTVYQKMVIQNKISETAFQKLNVILDVEHPEKYPVDIAYLQGQIDFGNYLLELSDTLELELETKRQELARINSME